MTDYASPIDADGCILETKESMKHKVVRRIATDEVLWKTTIANRKNTLNT